MGNVAQVWIQLGTKHVKRAIGFAITGKVTQEVTQVADR